MLFFETYAENEVTRLGPDRFYFRKASYELVGTSVSISFDSSQFGKTIKKNYKLLDY